MNELNNHQRPRHDPPTTGATAAVAAHPELAESVLTAAKSTRVRSQREGTPVGVRGVGGKPVEQQGNATDVMLANGGSGNPFAGEVADVEEFHVVVATSRPTLEGFFAAMGQQASSPVLVTVIPLSSVAVADAADVIGAASAAVVDASHDPGEALEICRLMRVHRPALPISAVFCCPHSATATLLRALAAAGVRAFLDLQLSADEALRVLRSVARGHGVVHLQITEEARTLVFKEFAGEGVRGAISEDDLQLLELVALGLTDDEIGRQMYLSRHTVKHRIERLRRRVEARNRVQLAVWACRQHAERR